MFFFFFRHYQQFPGGEKNHSALRTPGVVFFSDSRVEGWIIDLSYRWRLLFKNKLLWMGKDTHPAERNYSISPPVPDSTASSPLSSVSFWIIRSRTALCLVMLPRLSGLARKADSKGGRFWLPGQLLCREATRRGWVNAWVGRSLPMRETAHMFSVLQNCSVLTSTLCC